MRSTARAWRTPRFLRRRQFPPRCLITPDVNWKRCSTSAKSSRGIAMLRRCSHELAVRLHSVVDSYFLTLALHDHVRNVMRLHVLETRMETGKPLGREHLVDGTRLSVTWDTKCLPQS